jgi:hypothetical protein
MGFNEVPPDYVSPYYFRIYNATFKFGMICWVLCYILIARESLRTKSYGMPLFALANNFAWELIHGLCIVDSTFERVAIVVWMLIDTPIIYATVKYGRYEWEHAPVVKRNLGKIFFGLTAFCALAHWAWAHWWITNGVSMKQGKFYLGVEGPDIKEMSFWSVELAQTIVSVTSLAQLITRQHTGGCSWAIWYVIEQNL